MQRQHRMTVPSFLSVVPTSPSVHRHLSTFCLGSRTDGSELIAQRWCAQRAMRRARTGRPWSSSTKTLREFQPSKHGRRSALSGSKTSVRLATPYNASKTCTVSVLASKPRASESSWCLATAGFDGSYPKERWIIPFFSNAWIFSSYRKARRFVSSTPTVRQSWPRLFCRQHRH